MSLKKFVQKLKQKYAKYNKITNFELLDLPDDCLLDIFDNLTLRELIQVSKTNKHLNKLVRSYSIKSKLIKFPVAQEKWPINLLSVAKRIGITNIQEHERWQELVDLIVSNASPNNIEEFYVERVFHMNFLRLEQLAPLLTDVRILDLKGYVGGEFERFMNLKYINFFHVLFNDAEDLRTLTLRNFNIIDPIGQRASRNLRELTIVDCRISLAALTKMIESAGLHLKKLIHSKCKYDEPDRYKAQSKIFNAIISHAPNLQQWNPFTVVLHPRVDVDEV